MQVGRVILLGLALVAGGGAVLLVSAGNGNDGDAVSDRQTNVELIEVLVANREFTRGERLNALDTSWVEWPVSALNDHFVTSENKEYLETIDEALARAIIVEGEPIFENKLVRSADSGILSALLTKGMRAVSVDVSTSQGTSGFILPGDRVDLHFARDDSNIDRRREPAGFFGNLKVLAIDQTLDHQEDSATIIGTTVTLEIHPAQVEKFMARKESDAANLALRSIFNSDGADGLDEEFEPSSVLIMRYGQS